MWLLFCFACLLCSNFHQWHTCIFHMRLTSETTCRRHANAALLGRTQPMPRCIVTFSENVSVPMPMAQHFEGRQPQRTGHCPSFLGCVSLCSLVRFCCTCLPVIPILVIAALCFNLNIKDKAAGVKHCVLLFCLSILLGHTTPMVIDAQWSFVGVQGSTPVTCVQCIFMMTVVAHAEA